MPENWNPPEEEEGLSARTTTLLHKGEGVIIDKGYTLSYNDDDDGYYYLRYEGEVHSFSWPFTEVERTGEETFNLKRSDQPAGFYIRDIMNFENLRDALITLADATP